MNGYSVTGLLKTVVIVLAFCVGSLAMAADSRDYVRTRGAPTVAADSPSQQGLYGLVIGINAYDDPMPTLDGAINDADDVADALKKRNANKVWLLENKAVTRDHVMAAWHALVGTAKPGDMVLVHLAGHGARSPERIPGTGSDGLDEFLVLPTFKQEGPDTRERIVNKEWGALLREVPQFKVIFVADTCHSGSMTRGYHPRKLKTRLLSRDTIILHDDALPLPDKDKWSVSVQDLSHVAYFGAVGRAELDPEVLIRDQPGGEEKPRGALSWAVANGLRGAADLNKDGIVTKEELVTYVTDNVKTQTEGEQHPSILPGGVELKLPVGQTAAAPPLNAPSAPLTLEIPNATRVSPTDLVSKLHNVVLVSDGKAADLTWDVAQGKLRNQAQDTLIFPEAAPGAASPTPAAEASRDYRRTPPQEVASARDGLSDLPRMQAAIDKRVVALWLGTLSASQPLTMTLTPLDTVQHKGDHAVLSISGNDSPFLTVVNLGPSGNINLLYPVDGDPLEIQKGQPYQIPMTADGPFGAEHFLAIASDRALTSLHKGLAAIDGKPQLDEFKRLLADAIHDVKFQMGIHSVFTSP